MPNLERLVISDSATVDDLSSLSMNTWQHLEKLDLSWNNTTSNASSYEEQVAALVEFNLDDMITAGLNLSQLTQLGLSQTTLSDDDLLNIATNVGSNLEVLRLRDINFSNYSNLFDNLNTPNLIRLSIGTYITDQEKKIDFDLSNIDDNLTPGKLERLYLENGNISHFSISEFSSLKRLRLNDSSISDMTLTEFNSDIQQLTELEDLEIDNLIIDGEVVYCSDLVLYSGTDCEDEEADTVLFTTELISGQTWYTSDFFELVFNEDGTSLMATSLINSEESNEEPLTLTIDSGNLMIGDDQELSIDTENDNAYNTTLTNLDDQTDEKIILYTNLSAFKATLYSGLSDGITIVDSSNDSTNSGYSGFELESVTAIEDGDNLIITVNAAGNILTALNSSAPNNYNNVFWIGINQYFDFGFSKSGEAWLDQDIWENGEYTEGSEVDSNVYEYTILDDTVTLTIPLSIIPSNDYLSIKVEIGIDQFGSADEAEDDAAYDAIYLGIDW
ncbi:hypothetical protein [Psychromonas sp. KJ10-2]|uniref:hypothetical protein n=1 Tax=Psychromonas sp. KJ10-2 TaxID=3391822 RepID=UPI0039B6754B